MAAKFTLFPQLITELRLEIWRHALPAPFREPFYPYKKGCWVIEERGLEPDPNGESLHLEFKSSLLDPLPVDLPLYSVNREARDIALNYIREQGLTIPRDGVPATYKFLRHFDPRTDTMFLPTVDIDSFFTEQSRLSRPVISRLAVTVPGFGILRRELESFTETCGPIDRLYVLDSAHGSTCFFQELQDADKYGRLGLGDAPRALLKWRSDLREWGVTGDDYMLAQMEKRVDGVNNSASSTSRYDLEI